MAREATIRPHWNEKAARAHQMTGTRAARIAKAIVSFGPMSAHSVRAGQPSTAPRRPSGPRSWRRRASVASPACANWISASQRWPRTKSRVRPGGPCGAPAPARRSRSAAPFSEPRSWSWRRSAAYRASLRAPRLIVSQRRQDFSPAVVDQGAERRGHVDFVQSKSASLK